MVVGVVVLFQERYVYLFMNVLIMMENYYGNLLEFLVMYVGLGLVMHGN